MARIVIRDGRVIDPASGIDRITDVLVQDGNVVEIADRLPIGNADHVIDARGKIVCPGLIDAHVHFRDPGLTHKESLQTGARSALAGGFVRVCCMPNTEPPLDTPERVADIVTRGGETGIHIHPIGTITVGRKLEELAPLAEMAAAGAIGFSDDGESTRSEETMRRALTLSRDLNRPIMVHCEDPALVGGSMHDGIVSRELGQIGLPALAEENFIERDIRLAEDTGGWLHVLHVSTRRGAEMIRQAKARGVRVTAEVMPHHLTLTDEWVAGRRRFVGETQTFALDGIDTNAKVNPPLRPEAEALGLVEYLVDGTFDFVATDHAPHSPAEKSGSLADAPSGMLGLEFALPLMARLVARGEISWSQVVDWFTRAPAATLNLPGGRIRPGDAADIVVLDPDRSWTVSAEIIQSRSKNTPLLGMSLRGRAVLTMVDGEIRHDELSRT